MKKLFVCLIFAVGFALTVNAQGGAGGSSEYRVFKLNPDKEVIVPQNTQDRNIYAPSGKHTIVINEKENLIQNAFTTVKDLFATNRRKLKPNSTK